MGDKINRMNMYQFSISAQMDYRKARRAEAQEIMAKSAQTANSFASISSNRVAEEGNLISRIAMTRMQGSAVSKKA